MLCMDCLSLDVGLLRSTYLGTLGKRRKGGILELYWVYDHSVEWVFQRSNESQQSAN